MLKKKVKSFFSYLSFLSDSKINNYSINTTIEVTIQWNFLNTKLKN